MARQSQKALRLIGVKEIWLQTFWDVYGFQFDSSLGVIWPLNKKFRELKELIHEDQIAYEVVQIFFDDYNRARII